MRTYEEQISAVENRMNLHLAKKRRVRKIAFSCMSVLLVITASVTAVLVGNSYNMKEKDSGKNNAAPYELLFDSMDNATIEATGAATELEIITATKFYGNITESNRSKGDIFEILGEENDKISAYEDKNYIYFFYPDGRLHRMQNIAEIHNAVFLETDNEGIKDYAEKHLKRYISFFDSSNYEVTVDYTPNAYPAWHLCYTITDNNIIIDEINIRFLDNGELYYLSHQTCAASVAVSAEEAVDTALKEINEKFGVDISDTDNYEISAFVAPSDNGDCYSITVGGIPYNDGNNTFNRAFFIEIDANNGKTLSCLESG